MARMKLRAPREPNARGARLKDAKRKRSTAAKKPARSSRAGAKARRPPPARGGKPTEAQAAASLAVKVAEDISGRVDAPMSIAARIAQIIGGSSRVWNGLAKKVIDGIRPKKKD